MSELAEKLLSQALTLTAAERARLAAELIASVDGEPDPDASAAWAAEIDRRVRQIDKDGPRGDDWNTVHARVSANFQRK